MNYWLMKSEPDVFGIDDLAKSPRKTTHWDGVRNFQARSSRRKLCSAGSVEEVMLPACAVTNRCSRTGATGGVRRQDLRLPGWTGFAHHHRQSSTPKA